MLPAIKTGRSSVSSAPASNAEMLGAASMCVEMKKERKVGGGLGKSDRGVALYPEGGEPQDQTKRLAQNTARPAGLMR
jgi:hypothetical protein